MLGAGNGETRPTAYRRRTRAPSRGGIDVVGAGVTPIRLPTWGDRFAARAFSIARDLHDTRSIVARFPWSSAVTRSADDAERLADTARRTWGAGFGVDVGDKGLEARGGRYDEFKDKFKAEVGSTL